MPAYFSLGNKSSDFVSNRYLHINNCGFCEDLDNTKVSRPQGRKDYQLIYLKSGQMEFEESGQLQILTGGNAYLYRPGTPQHYQVNGTKTTFYWIHFTGSALSELLADLPEGRIVTGEFPEFERFCKTFYIACKTSQNPNILYYEGQLICLLANITEKSKSHSLPPHISKIDAALLAMHHAPSLRLSNEELAKRCGLSRYYFIKLFKSVIGQTPQQYYTLQALETAKGLLENTDYTVGQIAVLCGIEDNFYFSRLFKKHTGLSPADYRKTIRHGFADP